MLSVTVNIIRSVLYTVANLMPSLAGGGEGSSPLPLNSLWIIHTSHTEPPSICFLSVTHSHPFSAIPSTGGCILVPPQTSDGLFKNPRGGQDRPDENGVQTYWGGLPCGICFRCYAVKEKGFLNTHLTVVCFQNKIY